MLRNNNALLNIAQHYNGASFITLYLHWQANTVSFVLFRGSELIHTSPDFRSADDAFLAACGSQGSPLPRSV